MTAYVPAMEQDLMWKLALSRLLLQVKYEELPK